MIKSLTTPFLFFILFLGQQVRAQVQSAAPGLEPNPSFDENSTGPPWKSIVVATFLFIGGFLVYLCCFVQGGNWSDWRRRWGNVAALLWQYSSKSTTNTLDPHVVKSFPTFEYGAIKSGMIGKGRTLECAVCLMEFNHKDVLRLIPKCDHVFHADCVDGWLVGHATCPVCRLNLANVEFRDNHDQNYVVLEEENRNPTTRSLSLPLSSRPSRLFVGLPRSLSAEHVAAKQREDTERFILPREVRDEIMSRSQRFGNDKIDRRGKSDSWVFSLTPSFRKELDKLEGVRATSTTTSKEESSSIDVVSVDEPNKLPV